MWCLPLRRRCLPLGRRGCRTLSVDCVHTSSKQTYPSSHTSPTSTYSSFTSCLIDGGCFQFAPFLLGFPVICGFKIDFWSCVFDMCARLVEKSPKRKWPNSSRLQPFWLFWPTPLLSWCYIPPLLCAPFEMGNQCAQISWKYFCHSEVTWSVDPASSTEQIDGLVSSSPEFNPASFSSCKKFCFCASIYPLHILRIHYIRWWRSCVTPPQRMRSGRRKGETNVV